MMKKIFTLLLLLILFSYGASSMITNTTVTPVKQNFPVLPQSIFGEWYDLTEDNEYNGLLIHPKFIEYNYRAFMYKEFDKVNDSVYNFTAEDHLGDKLYGELEIFNETTIVVKRNQGQKTTFVKKDLPLYAKSVSTKNTPDKIQGSWFSTDGDSELRFVIGQSTFQFQGTNYEIEEIMHFKEPDIEQYRFIVQHGDDYRMFYLKNWGEGYLQIGFDGRAGDYYKNKKDYPDKKIEGFTDFIHSIKGQWYTTDGSDQIFLDIQSRQFNIDGKPNTYANLEKDIDIYRVTLSDNSNQIKLKPMADNYLFYSSANGEEKLLKHRKDLPDYTTEKNESKKLAGNWFTTDGTAKKILTITEDGIEFKGQRLKNPQLYRVSEGVSIREGQELQKALVTKVFSEHIELKTEGQTLILKRSKTTSDIVELKATDLPEYLKGDWFDVEGDDYWSYAITDEFLVADKDFWTYKDINYADGQYQITAGKDGATKELTIDSSDPTHTKIIENSATKSTYIKDKTAAHLKDQKSNNSDKNEVLIKGYVKDFSKHDLPRNVTFLVNSLPFDEQISYDTQLDEQGRFSVALPKAYGQDIYMKYQTLQTLFVQPGDTIFISYDPDSHQMEFMGDNQLTNYNMVDYFRGFMESFSREEAMENQRHLKQDTFTVYKEYETNRYKNREKRFYDNFMANTTTSTNFKKWAKNSVIYRLADNLMRYRWLHDSNQSPGERSIPEEYVNIIDSYSFDLDRNIISSNFQGYVHELGMLKFGLHGSFSDYLDVLEGQGVEISPDLRALLIKSSQITTARGYKELDPKEIMQLSDFHTDYNEAFNKIKDSLDRMEAETYFTDNQLVQLDQLSKTREIYRSINNLDTLELGKVFPEKIKEIHKESFKDLLSEHYERTMKEARVPFKLALSELNTDNPSSAEKLLAEIQKKHEGKVIYIDFWATWCGPCIAEMPNAARLKENLEGKEVAFVYLCGSSPEKTWKKMIDRHKIKGDHYYVNDKAWQELSGKFGITGIPHYALIDREGNVVNKSAERPSIVENAILQLLE